MIRVDLKLFKDYIDSMGFNQYTRKRRVVYSRYVCFKFMRDYGYTFEHIGEMFDKSNEVGKLDHATVLAGVNKYHELKWYADFKEIKEDIEVVLKSFTYKQSIFDITQYDLSLFNLTSIERNILECTTIADFTVLKNIVIKSKILPNLAESKVSNDSFHLVG